MANCSLSLATVAGLLALAAAPCAAQPPSYGPPGVGQPSLTSRPTVSPYLNLLRRGQPAALNYYNLVRPQNQFYQSIQQLQQDVGSNTQNLSALTLQQPAASLPPTGHLAGFMTHGQ